MPNTLFIGKVYYRFDELPSTNDWAAELLVLPTVPDGGTIGAAKTRPPEGTVVQAANQTAGRGQLGSRWQSSAGENLLLSIILYPIWLEASAQFYLSMAVALALRDLVTTKEWEKKRDLRVATQEKTPAFKHSPSLAKIKWPNDLYLSDKKTAGILIQNALSGAHLQSSIVGIGLNVNQLHFPDDLPNASSLAKIFGEGFDLEEVAAYLFECLERRYLQLKSGQRAAIKSEYEEHLWLRGKTARFVRNAEGSEFEGTILGVSERGMLQIETETGVEEFEVKALRFIGPFS